MCSLEFPDLQADLHEPFADQGLTILGVAAGSFGEDAETLQAFATQTNVTFPLVWDDGTYAQYAWPDGESPFPRQALIDRDGVVRYLASEHRADELRAAVEALLE